MILITPTLVIASVAKQSRAYCTAALDCFVATLLAMTRVSEDKVFQRNECFGQTSVSANSNPAA
ncbi:MAG: hypothetical protein BGO08_08520 [Altererythrobacter sp. 66-12]|nr:MAG: hypothetical protein BGO08_08520 [Altererythrobacter sp. 66-12]